VIGIYFRECTIFRDASQITYIKINNLKYESWIPYKRLKLNIMFKFIDIGHS
jgi:hypothetical protein